MANLPPCFFMAYWESECSGRSTPITHRAHERGGTGNHDPENSTSIEPHEGLIGQVVTSRATTSCHLWSKVEEDLAFENLTFLVTDVELTWPAPWLIHDSRPTAKSHKNWCKSEVTNEEI